MGVSSVKMQNATSIKHIRLQLISVQDGCTIANDASTQIIRIKLGFLTANGLVTQQIDVKLAHYLGFEHKQTFPNLLMWEIQAG